MSRVLFVDDDADELELRRLIFENHGYEVMTAGNAGDARSQFSATPPDSVILDPRLPDVEDGLALIREFRAASRDLKIVVLAGWPADLEGRPESTLVDAVLSKPVRSEVLLNALA